MYLAISCVFDELNFKFVRSKYYEGYLIPLEGEIYPFFM